MSKVKVASIVCDGPSDDVDVISDCPHAEAYEELGTVTEIRKQARELGWRMLPHGRDRCPKCVASRPQPST